MVEINREFLVEKYGNDNLINLTEIDISCNHIRKIDSNIFKGLTKLETLYLSDNEIEEIEVRLFDTLSNLKRLDLSHNKLKRIDSNTFKGLIKLETLYLSDNEIEEIEVSLFESLSNLEELWMHNIKLKRIDSNTFKGLTKLKKLKLSDNEIEEIEVRLFETLSNLEVLHLDNNKLKRIDLNTFNRLDKLDTLWLNHNEIEEIEVRLFDTLSNLKVLWMHNNKLKRIESNTFKHLIKLEWLRLEWNEIEEIDVRLFESLSNLKELSLSNNKLKRIDSNTFKDLTKLDTLWLYSNEIEMIDVRLFESLSNLKLLRLFNNKLKEIDRKCFEPLKSIEVIEIYENFGLNALSFIKPSTPDFWYNEDNLKKYGSISEWNKFLQQFPQLERSSSSGSSAQKSRKEDPLIGETFNSRYKAKKLLGRGSFGRVFLVYDETEKIDKAMKMMEKFDSNEEDRRESYVPVELSESAQNELKLMKQIKHENIIRYFDNFDENLFNTDYLCIICEFCPNRDLKAQIREAIESKRTFSEVTILNWTLEATNGLKYLHSNKIIHRDIKSENIFLDETNVIKLGDLGLSKLIESTKASTFAGTPVYMSPEQFKCLHDEYASYSAKTDIWSLGCVVFELLFLKLAFPRGQRGNPTVPDLGFTLFSRILKKMLEKNVDNRFDSTELFDSLMKIKSVVD